MYGSYLGELSEELKLQVGRNRAIELTTEVAEHLSQTQANPNTELGQPVDFADQLTGDESKFRYRAMPSLVGVSMFLALFSGMDITANSGVLDLAEFVGQIGIPIIFGGMIGYRLRILRFLSRSPLNWLVALATIAVVAWASLRFIQPPFDGTTIEVPGGTLTGFVLLAAILPAIWILRPLKFDPGSGLRASWLGHIKVERTISAPVAT